MVAQLNVPKNRKKYYCNCLLKFIKQKNNKKCSHETINYNLFKKTRTIMLNLKFQLTKEGGGDC